MNDRKLFAWNGTNFPESYLHGMAPIFQFFVRIDKQIEGFSYDIPKSILHHIREAKLVIADLTNQNANVYYEAGYAQGLIHAKLGNTAQILYLISNPQNPDDPFAAGKFDVNHYKMIPYKNTGNGTAELEENLIKELKAFYGIGE